MILGLLRVVIGADLGPLKNAAGSVGNILGTVGNVVEKTMRRIRLAVAAATVAVIALTTSSQAQLDVQSKLAARLNTTIESVQTIAHTADLAGVSFESMAKSVETFQTQLAMASRLGAGPAYEALQRLGLSANQLLAMPIDERLGAIAAKFQELGYSVGQQADALRQFRIRGTEIITMLRNGGSDITAAKDEIYKLGLAVNTIDGQKIEAANDAFRRVQLVLRGIGNQLAVQVAPALQAVSEWLTGMAEKQGGFANVVRSTIAGLISGFGAFVDVLERDVSPALQNIFIYLKNEIIDFKTRMNDLAGFWTVWLYQPFKDIEAKSDYVKAKLETPPRKEQWLKWWNDITNEMNERAIVNAIDEAMKKKKAPDVDPFTDDQKKAYGDRLSALKATLGSEFDALKENKEKQIREIEDLENRGYLAKKEGHRLKLEAEKQYQDKFAELTQTTFENQYLTEEEIAQRSHDQRLQQLAEFEQARTDLTAQASEIRRRLEEKHAIDMRMIVARQYSALAGIVDTALGQMSQVIGAEGGAAFEIMKAISYATALVKGYEAVVSAWATGNATGIPGMGAALAAVTAAGVGAQIAALSRIRPGDSGTLTGGGGSTAQTPAAAPATAATNSTLTVQGLTPGQLFTTDAMRDFAERLIEFQRQGGDILLK